MASSRLRAVLACLVLVVAAGSAETDSHGYLQRAKPRPFQYVPPLLCRDNLAELAMAMNLTGYAVEIGVFTGIFSAKNLAKWRGKHYYMIDAWDRSRSASFA